MNLSEQNKLEQQLLGLLNESESPYREALQLLESHEARCAADADEVTNCLIKLEPYMKRVQEIETRLGPCREKWIQLGFKANSSLKQIFAQHQELLSRLILKINQLEEHAKKAKQVVAASVDFNVRHQQMQKAYQSASR